MKTKPTVTKEEVIKSTALNGENVKGKSTSAT